MAVEQQADRPQFDLVIHLAGEQAIPNLLAMRQVPAARHVVVASNQTSPTVGRLRAAQGGEVKAQVVADPYDIGAIRESIQGAVAGFEGRRTVFNVTGGTKPMALAALQVAERMGAPRFYIETTKDTLYWLHDDRREPLAHTLAIEDFIVLAGHGVQTAGRWEDRPEREARRELTERLWQYRTCLAKVQKAASESARTRADFAAEGRAKGLSLRVEYSRRKGRISFDGQAAQEECSWPDFCEYVAGRWFEELVHQRLLPLRESGRISDLRIGLAPSWEKAASESGDGEGIQEFDAAFTDGLRLFIVECKAGNVRQEDVQKLENNVRRFGGAMGQGFLASVWPLSPAVRARIEGSRSLAAFCGQAVLSGMADRILTTRPGAVVGMATQGWKRS